MSRIATRYLVGAAIIGVVVGAITLRRFAEIRSADGKVTRFCATVHTGDGLLAVVERVEPHASRLGAAASTHPPSLPDDREVPPSAAAAGFNVIFETHEGQLGWPRYVIWTGPLYGRTYCSLESTPEGKVKAVHLGTIYDGTQKPGFVESMLEDWSN